MANAVGPANIYIKNVPYFLFFITVVWAASCARRSLLLSPHCFCAVVRRSCSEMPDWPPKNHRPVVQSPRTRQDTSSNTASEKMRLSLCFVLLLAASASVFLKSKCLLDFWNTYISEIWTRRSMSTLPWGPPSESFQIVRYIEKLSDPLKTNRQKKIWTTEGEQEH